jgi:polyhydroxybutyrate depolymerase
MMFSFTRQQLSKVGLLYLHLALLFTISACGRSTIQEAVQTGTAPPPMINTFEFTPTEKNNSLDTSTLVNTVASGLPARLSPGDHALSLIAGGIERTYVLHIPPSYNGAAPVPLILAFHGIGLDASEMNRISKFSTQADLSGFLVAYPEGTGQVRSWNGGHCCGTAARDAVDDVGFVRSLISEISSQLDVDPRQVYATGFSNGAIFTYRLACELSDVLAAVAPVSATQIEDDQQACTPARSIPLIHFHGTADPANPYDGGTTQAGFRFLSVPEAIAHWVGVDGCNSAPQTSTNGSIVHDIYTSCSSGTSVELYTINGGMHAWPGGEMVNKAMGAPSMEIDATALIWDFFQSHPMP